jgi:hypothetical protein
VEKLSKESVDARDDEDKPEADVELAQPDDIPSPVASVQTPDWFAGHEMVASMSTSFFGALQTPWTRLGLVPPPDAAASTKTHSVELVVHTLAVPVVTVYPCLLLQNALFVMPEVGKPSAKGSTKMAAALSCKRDDASTDESSRVDGAIIEEELRTGCQDLPSLGSVSHPRICKPCAFGPARCRSGKDCEFCHLCLPPAEKSKRGRWVLKRRKNLEELHADMLDKQQRASQRDSH